MLRHLELLPRPLGQDWSELWLQRFSGTITIWPKSIPSDFLYILTDPTPERLARMIHVGQQSAFPKLKFIANRAKLEYAIQEGRRRFRPRGARDDDIVNTLSEEDLRSLLKRTGSDGPDGAALYPASESESSSTAGPSRPSSPVNLPLGLTFARKKKNAPADLANTAEKPDAPDSPSLGKRLSGWWSAMSPQATTHSTPLRARPRDSPFSHDRPNSMFEFRPSGDIIDVPTGRKQSRVFDDSDDAEGSQDVPRRRQQHKGGMFGDTDAGMKDAEDHGEAADFGDDEEDRDEVQNVGVGLGLEGQGL